MEIKCTTVEDIMQKSIFEENRPGVPTSFRLEDDVKTEAMVICRRHGTNLSLVLRQFCLALVSDYAEKNPLTPPSG